MRDHPGGVISGVDLHVSFKIMPRCHIWPGSIRIKIYDYLQKFVTGNILEGIPVLKYFMWIPGNLSKDRRIVDKTFFREKEKCRIKFNIFEPGPFVCFRILYIKSHDLDCLSAKSIGLDTSLLYIVEYRLDIDNDSEQMFDFQCDFLIWKQGDEEVHQL